MSYIMDGEEQVVYSAGNSWIVCRSKSYSGRIYYFNTLTGEAAWNLSDSEIEKAKQRTKNLAKQNKINIQECPEPEEPPMDQTNAKLPQGSQNPQSALSEGAAESSSSRVYNKQVINNKITKQSYPFPFLVSPYNVVANSINPMLPIAVNPTPAYNSNVWAVPPNHQLYIVPSEPSLVNQSQPTPVNVAFKEQDPTFTVQNTSTLSGQFKNLRSSGFHSMPQKGRGRGSGHYQRPNFTPNRENHKIRQHYEQYQNNFRKDIGVNDLRQLLSAKKQRRASFHEYNTQGFEAENVAANTTNLLSYESHGDYPTAKQSGYESDGDNQQTVQQADYESDREYLGHDRETQKDKIEANDADSDWLEEHIIVEDRKLKLDISNLKGIAKPDMDAECWYIVADKDFLLHHLNFLNILCNSDDHCFLMVAQQVMAELHEVSRDKSSPRSAARARRAVSFLLQQLDAGYVVIGDGTCGENDTRCDYLLNCCSNLYEQNFHVVLLSNNDEFDAYKNSTNVPIFNIKEIKQLLTKDVHECQPDLLKSPPKCKTSEIQKTDRLKPPPCLKKLSSLPKGPIKITVANDLAKPTDYKTKACKISIATQFNDDVNTTEKSFETVPEENDSTSHLNNSISSIKSTVESAVQTDFQMEVEFTHLRDNLVTFPQTSRSEASEKTPEDEKEANNDFPTPSLSKREIRLNRSVKTSASSEDTSNNVGKKHFKWRRKRHVSSSGIDSKLSSEANSSNADENSRDSLNIKKADKVSTSCEQTVTRNKFEESLSSEASSLLITRNVTNGTLVVEETSTSGIISNSASNVDSESEGGNKDTSLNETRSQKSVMYEVTDQTMEECLRTMNDEWVSRFIQIMEEVLDQVLRKDEKFLNEVVYKLHGGGPWNIREAADCIKRKFNNNEDIIEAASKLTDIYMKISDRTGRITANIQPSEFMEMYSFGKYLIDSMLSVLQDCEDLESAAQSLQRLLADIQNPNFDASHNESFDTHPQDVTAKGLSSVNDDTMPSSKIKESNTYTTPTKQIIKRSERVTQFNSPAAVDSLKQAEEIPQSNSPGQAGLKSAELAIQSHSPGRNSLRGSGEGEGLTSPEQGSHKNAESVTLLNSSGQGSVKKGKEDVQSHSSGRSSLPRSGKVTQYHSPGLGSTKRPEEVTKFQSPGRSSLRMSHSPRQGSFKRADVIQSSSPEKGGLRRNEEFTQSISPGQSGQRRSVEVPQSISPGQGSLRIIEDDIQSHSPGKSSLRESEEVVQSHSPGQGNLKRDESIIQSKSPSEGTPYKLRSRNKSSPQNDAVGRLEVPKDEDAVASGNKKIDNIKFIRNVDVKHNFLTSLNLVEKVGEVDSQPIESDSPPKPGTKEPVAAAVDNSSQDLMRSIFDRNLDENSQEQSCTESKTETKVIRNFTICPEFEKKLEKPVEREPLDMDQLDYSDMYNDDDNFMNEDYYSDEDYYENDNDVQDENATDENYLVNARDVSEEEMPVIRTDPNAYFRVDDKFICDSPLSMNNTLNTIFGTVISRVKEQLLNVQTFCKETREDLNASQKHSIRIKYEMNENAERVQNLLTNMIKSLNSIFCRETYEPEKNIQTLLKDHGIHDFDLNDNQLKVYRDVIGQCLEQAQILQESVALIVTAIKKKPIE